MELQLKRIMREQGRTHQWLGDQLGTSAQYVGQLVTGKAGATLTQYERIATILGVKLWQLFAPQKEYVTREEHDRIVAELTAARRLADRPDLITVDRHTGRTRRYALLPDQPASEEPDNNTEEYVSNQQ
jgi:transcriptional regulator with XRE-family HTH domain